LGNKWALEGSKHTLVENSQAGTTLQGGEEFHAQISEGGDVQIKEGVQHMKSV